MKFLNFNNCFGYLNEKKYRRIYYLIADLNVMLETVDSMRHSVRNYEFVG